MKVKSIESVRDDTAILLEGRRVIEAEGAALGHMADLLDARFCDAVRAISDCSGRIVTTAIGKSGFVARKIASTLASLGRPAFFVHPIEALHGDLGMVQPGDVVLAISHSGNSRELLSFVEAVRMRYETKVMAIVGTSGALAEAADIVLKTGVTTEACALGLAPTTSSTAALSLGDALAVAASTVNGFKAENFANLHPAGILGDRLRTPVEHMMQRDYPRIDGDRALRDAIEPMTRGGIGLVIVHDRATGRIGIITDGDIRRRASHGAGDLEQLARNVMSTPPRSIQADALGFEALMEMERERVTALVVLDGNAPVGVVHIHDILRHGLGITGEPSKRRTRRSSHP